MKVTEEQESEFLQYFFEGFTLAVCFAFAWLLLCGTCTLPSLLTPTKNYVKVMGNMSSVSSKGLRPTLYMQTVLHEPDRLVVLCLGIHLSFKRVRLRSQKLFKEIDQDTAVWK